MPLLVTCIALGLVIAGTVCWFVLRRPAVHSADEYRAVVSATEDRHSARNEAIAPEMRQRLERDLRLACEHLDSLQILIQVAATHHQSVPPLGCHESQVCEAATFEAWSSTSVATRKRTSTVLI